MVFASEALPPPIPSHVLSVQPQITTDSSGDGFEAMQMLDDAMLDQLDIYNRSTSDETSVDWSEMEMVCLLAVEAYNMIISFWLISLGVHFQQLEYDIDTTCPAIRPCIYDGGSISESNLIRQ